MEKVKDCTQRAVPGVGISTILFFDMVNKLTKYYALLRVQKSKKISKKNKRIEQDSVYRQSDLSNYNLLHD